MGKYSSQVILSLLPPSSRLPGAPHINEEALLEKLKKDSENDVSLIYFDPNSQTHIKKEFKKLNTNSCLYLIAHGKTDDNDNIYGHKRETTFSLDFITKLIADNVPKTFPETPGKQQPFKKEDIFSPLLTISLIVCYGGKQHTGSVFNSFAGKLQQQLTSHNIYVDINARVVETIIRNTGRKETVKKDMEIESSNINKTLPFLIEKINNFDTPIDEKIAAQITLNELYIQKNELFIPKQNGSKLTFKWVKDNNENFIQVAYDSYELKKQEKCYNELNKLVTDLKKYAQQKEDQGHPFVKEEVNNLVKIIKTETNSYFKSIYKNETMTNQFKNNINNAIDHANETLGKNRDPLFKRIVGKIALAVSSLLFIPNFFLHKNLVKQGVLSQGLFSNKTAGKKLTDRVNKTINNISPIELKAPLRG